MMRMGLGRSHFVAASMVGIAIGLTSIASLALAQSSSVRIDLEDVTASSKIDFVEHNGASGRYYIMETVVGGLATFDYDGDGWIDVLLTQSANLPGVPATQSKSSKLYRNRGDGTFEDVTKHAGLENEDYVMGVVAGDWNNDGWPDLYFSNYGWNRLFLNAGDGTFVDQSEVAGVRGKEHLGAGVSFFDMEGDGDLDLFVANYVDFSMDKHQVKTIGKEKFHAGPADFQPALYYCFRNRGDGTFEDVSLASGIGKTPGYGMGLVAADFDRDGDVDLFACNDGTANFYFENDGRGTFTEKAIEKGVAFDGAGKANSNMGVDVGDFDGDGFLDLITTTYQNEMPVLYQNLQGLAFVDATRQSKLDRKLYRHVTWGTSLVDLDLDADLDLFFACGHFMENVAAIDDRTEYKVRNVILTNQGVQGFQDTTESNGSAMQIVESSRGAAFDDLDNDGDIDIVVLNINARPTVHRNQTQTKHHWLALELVGVASNRNAVGAEVSIQTKRKEQVAQVLSGRGYQSHYGSRLVFGLGGEERVEKIRVKWPSGLDESFEGLAPDRRHVLIEGRGTPWKKSKP